MAELKEGQATLTEEQIKALDLKHFQKVSQAVKLCVDFVVGNEGSEATLATCFPRYDKAVVTNPADSSVINVKPVVLEAVLGAWYAGRAVPLEHDTALGDFLEQVDIRTGRDVFRWLIKGDRRFILEYFGEHDQDGAEIRATYRLIA